MNVDFTHVKGRLVAVTLKTNVKVTGCVFGGLRLVPCILSCSDQIKILLNMFIQQNYWDWAEHINENASATIPAVTELFSCIIMCVHMLRNRSKALLGRPIIMLDGHLLLSMAFSWSEQHFRSCEDTKYSVDLRIAWKDLKSSGYQIIQGPKKVWQVKPTDYYRKVFVNCLFRIFFNKIIFDCEQF